MYKTTQNEVQNLKNRISKSFNLSDVIDYDYITRKQLALWVSSQILKLSTNKKTKSSSSWYNNIFKNKNNEKNASESLFDKLETLKKFIAQGHIPKEFNLSKEEAPEEILEKIEDIKGKNIPDNNYYGIMSGPFFQKQLIKTKQDLNLSIEKVINNGIKFIRIDEAYVDKYQRNLIQQIFGRVFRNQGSLSIVVKIDIQGDLFENSSSLFLFLEDMKFQQQITIGKIDELHFKNEQILYKQLKIPSKNILQIFISQIFVVPLQALIPEFVIEVDESEAKIIKHHNMSHDESKDASHALKQHPSLRNPLFFLVKKYEITVQQLKNTISNRQIYANFFHSLQHIIQLMLQDFWFEKNSELLRASSFTKKTFLMIWNHFHNLISIFYWATEVINPIKIKVQLSEIFHRFCPIFNHMSSISAENIQDFKKLLNSLQIQSYMTTYISKNALENYREITYSSHEKLNKQYTSKDQIYKDIFQPVLNILNLYNFEAYQTAFILHFVAKNKQKKIKSQFDQSWTCKKLWKKLYKAISADVNLDIGLDMFLDLMGFHFGVNTIDIQKDALFLMKFQQQNLQIKEFLRQTFDLIEIEFSKQRENILSTFAIKGFKYHKYQLLSVLLDYQFTILSYDEVFQNDDILDENPDLESKRLQFLQKFQKKNPKVYRVFCWQRLMRRQLSAEVQIGNIIEVQTLSFGAIKFNKSYYESVFSQTGQFISNVTKNDYMYSTLNNNHKIYLQKVKKNVYITKLQHPMVPLIYSKAYQKLNLSHLLPNINTIINEKGMFTVSQCIQNLMNYEYACKTYDENFVNSLINRKYLSQAIVTSIIFFSENVTFKDIIFATAQSSDNILLMNLTGFYHSSGIVRQDGNCQLKCSNSLFCLDYMYKSIPIQTMNRFIDLDVEQYVRQLFLDLIDINKEISKIKDKIAPGQIYHNQLWGMIFQQQFILSFTQRLYKIKRIFTNYAKADKNLTHMELLQKISPAVAYFYQEVIASSESVLQRQINSRNDMWRRSFVNSSNFLNFISQAFKIPESYNRFPKDYKKLCFMGPSESLVKFSNNITKFHVFHEKFLSYKWYTKDNETLEYYLANSDLKNQSIQARNRFFNTLRQKSIQYLNDSKKNLPLTIVRLSSFDIIKANKEIFQNFSYERVKFLEFDDCKISADSFKALVNKLDNIVHLSIKNVNGLQYIGCLNYETETIEIKNLQTLIITSCQNLNYIDIKCDILSTIVLKDNKQLENVYIGSENLSKISCVACPKIRPQNMAVYILKGIDVHLCRNSCYGEIYKLYDNSYSIYLAKILNYLFTNFEQILIKNNLLVTLSKFGFVGFQLANYFSSTSILANIGSIALKLDARIQQNMLETLIVIFLLNQYVTTISVNHLISNNSRFLEIAVKALVNTPNVQKIRNISEIRVDSLKFDGWSTFINICCIIQLQRNLTLSLSSVEGYQKQLKQLVFNLTKKNKFIQNLTLKIYKSTIDESILEVLIKSQANLSNLTTFHLQDVIFNKNKSIEHQFTNLKHLILKNCQISDKQILVKYPAIVKLQISNSNIQTDIKTVLASMPKLKLLNFCRMFTNNKTVPFKNFCQTVQELYELKEIIMNSNILSPEDLNNFCEYCLSSKKNNIQTVTLTDFYKKQEGYQFDKLFCQSKVKELVISFVSSDDVKQFIQGIKSNKYLLNLNICIDFDIDPIILEPLKQNTILNEVTITNLQLPIWLLELTKKNKTMKSGIYIDIRHEYQIENTFRKKKINYFKMGLSMDGGGVRGVLLARQLEYLCKEVGYPIHKIFDYVGGTSIGGILTLACTGTLDGIHPICQYDKLVEIFTKYGPTIFKKDAMRQFASLFDTKYTGAGIEKVLKNYFKDCKLSQTLQQTNSIVTAVNRFDNKDVLFKSMDAILYKDRDFYLRDIGRATSAAPTYFPSAQIKNIVGNVTYSLLDGGMGLNNPSKLVLDELKKMAFNQGADNNYFLLSLGTGRLKTQEIPTSAGYKDLAPIIDSFSQSANNFLERDLVENFKGHFIRVSPTIELDRRQAELDKTQPEVLEYYQNVAYESAKKWFSKTITFGKYRNLSLVQWLRENTVKKYEEY